MNIRYATACSGIEAPSVAWEPLDWKPVAFSEVDPFCSKLLAERYPDVPNGGDMTTADWRELAGKTDVFIAGTPCQSFSVAGLRESLDDARGNLTLEYIRVIDRLKPRIAIWENVPGVLSTKDNAFGCFLAGLVGSFTELFPNGAAARSAGSEGVESRRNTKWPGAGIVHGPKRNAAWRTLDAQHFGVAQRRRRVFVVVTDARDPIHPGAILFEPESGRRDSPPSRKAGQDVAGTLAARTRGGGGLGTDTDLDGGLIAVAHTLRGDGFDVSEDGTGRGTPLVVASSTGDGYWREGDDTVGALRARAQESHEHIAFGANDSSIAIGFDTSPAIRSGNGGGRMSTAVASRRGGVRRLTPRECERLQGFPDDYTRINSHRKRKRMKPEELALFSEYSGISVDELKVFGYTPDGPRYKAIGNSMAVPVIRWIGRRIEKCMEAFG